ncbi:MAG: hypothetical protein LC791_17060 [Acidobacteria bacterium]|nr:hypothetical protein [Acidobacteriota bacterium]
MWGSRTACALWLLFAFAVFNVTFDRLIALEGARFTQANVERYQAGEPLVSIEAGYRPTVARSALIASLCGAGVLLTGLVAARFRPVVPPAAARDASRASR